MQSDSAILTEHSGGFKTDWDLFRDTGRLKTPRDSRVASYSHIERDISALKLIGVTHYRFGIEWARVEPSPGQFDEKAINHYVLLAKRLTEEKITPVVCLCHFSLPDWLSDFKQPDKHGLLHPDANAAWERYVRRMSVALAPYVQYFAPQNEPNIYALALTVGVFPPGRAMNAEFYRRLTQRQIDLFNRAAAIIREEKKDAKIISIQNIIHWQQDPLDILGIWYKMAIQHNLAHLDGIANNIDFLGFNYYQRETASLVAMAAQSRRKGDDVSDLGWIIDPEGLEAEIVDLSSRYRKPLLIMENGIATTDDDKRQTYLLRHLQAIRRTLDAGYDVRGYFHWSLCDNFEWHKGYEPRFGLFEVSADREILIPRRSAELYHSLIEHKIMSRDGAFPPMQPKLETQISIKTSN